MQVLVGYCVGVPETTRRLGDPLRGSQRRLIAAKGHKAEVAQGRGDRGEG